MANDFSRCRVAKATYDFSVSGGAQSTIALPTSDILPDGAIVTGVYAVEKTDVTSGGSATVTVVAGGITLTTAQAISGFTTSNDNVLKMTLANSASAKECTSNAGISVTIGTADITAGKIDFYLEYIL